MTNLQNFLEGLNPQNFQLSGTGSSRKIYFSSVGQQGGTRTASSNAMTAFELNGGLITL